MVVPVNIAQYHLEQLGVPELYAVDELVSANIQLRQGVFIVINLASSPKLVGSVMMMESFITSKVVLP